jgi:hypothetical protein
VGFRLRFSSSCPSDADSDFHAHSYAYSDFHAEPHAYTDGYTNPYSDLYSHADRNADCNLYVVLHSVTDCDDYANPIPYSNDYFDSVFYLYGDPYSIPHSNQDDDFYSI